MNDEEKDEIIHIVPQALTNRDDNPKNPKRKRLNLLIENVFEENKDRLANTLGYVDTAIAPIQTAYITYRVPNADEQKNAVFNWNHDARFLDALDEKLLIRHIPKTIRPYDKWFGAAFEGVWALWLGASPFAIVPIFMVSGATVLDTFLPTGLVGTSVAYTTAAVMVPAHMLQGREFARTIRGLFIEEGLTPSSGSDKKPHIFDHDHLNRDRTMALLMAVVRTAPYVAFLWTIEMNVTKRTHSLNGEFWAAGFTIPYCLHSMARAYSEYMDSRRRSNNKAKTEVVHMLSEKKKLLNHSIDQLQTLNNGKDSDELVIALDENYHEILTGKILLMELKDALENEDNDVKKREIFDTLVRYAKIKLKEKNIEQDLEEKISNAILLPKSLEEISVNQLYLDIESIIEIIILENNFKIYSDEKNTITLIYRYIQKSLGHTTPDQDLMHEVKSEVNPIFQEEKYEQRTDHLLTISKNLLKKTYYSKDKNKHLSESAASLGFVKYLTLINYNEITDTVVEGVSKISHLETNFEITSTKKQRKPPTEAEELIDAAQKLKDLNIEGIKKLHYDQDNLPPEPGILHTLREFPNYVLGLATPGRVLSAAYPLVTSNVLGKTLSKWGGYGLGLLDIRLRFIQERSLQEDFFTNLRYFGSRDNDFWPIRWAGKGYAVVCALPRTLATAGLIFAMTPGSSLENKLLWAGATGIGEFISDYQFYDKQIQEGITSMATYEPPQHLKDRLPPWLKVEQARARNNKRLNTLKNAMDEFDQPTTEQWYHLVTEAI